MFPPGREKAGNGGDGLTAVKEDDRDVRGCTLGRKGPGRPIGPAIRSERSTRGRERSGDE